jgi:hypothetical protein
MCEYLPKFAADRTSLMVDTALSARAITLSTTFRRSSRVLSRSARSKASNTTPSTTKAECTSTSLVEQPFLLLDMVNLSSTTSHTMDSPSTRLLILLGTKAINSKDTLPSNKATSRTTNSNNREHTRWITKKRSRRTCPRSFVSSRRTVVLSCKAVKRLVAMLVKTWILFFSFIFSLFASLIPKGRNVGYVTGYLSS